MNMESARRGAASTGRTQLIRHLEGERITRGQAIEAKCFECMGGYQDGRVDCRMPECALYGFMPYRDGPPESNPCESEPGKVAEFTTNPPVEV